jgi:hypothetical protein
MMFNGTIVVLAPGAPPDLLPARERIAVSHGAGGGEQNDGTLRDPAVLFQPHIPRRLCWA